MQDLFECQNKTDEKLVVLSLQYQRFFLCIMKRYEAKLLRYIKRITNVRNEEAEDILQEVFIKVYTNLNSFDTNLKFSSWIYRITRNYVISYYRSKKNKKEDLVWQYDTEIFDNIASDLNFIQEIDLELLRKSLQSVINKLDIKYKEVIILNYFEEKTYKEISDIIKKPEGTVATLLNRAKTKLKKIIEKEQLTI